MATYRVGNHQPQNLYRDDQYIGVMFSPDDAALIVEALNERETNIGHDRHFPRRDDDPVEYCEGCNGYRSIDHIHRPEVIS
jgi:hypothetical protein